MKLIKVLILLTVVLVIPVLALVYLFQERLVEYGIKYSIQQRTNLDIKMESIESRLQDGYLKIKGITLLNPPGFRERRFAKINFVLAELNLKDTLLTRKLHLKRFFVDLDRIYIVKQPRMTNVKALKKGRGGRGSKDLRGKFLIDDLRIRVGTLIYKDYTKDPPKLREYPLNIEERFEDVVDLKNVLNVILVKAATKVTFSRFRINFGNIKGGVDSIINNFLNFLKR